VGGGHAHLVTLANIHRFIEKGVEVSVIGPSEYHYYSGMGPGMLGRFYSPREIRFATKHAVEKQGGRFILDKAVKIDPQKKSVHLETGREIGYDVVSFNVGSFVRSPEINEGLTSIYPVKPIEKLLDARTEIETLVSEGETTIGIIGGGPSATEIAGNVRQLAEEMGRYPVKVLVFSGKSFMGNFSSGIQKRVIKSLVRRNVQIMDQGVVTGVNGKQVELASGETYDVDFLFLALGVSPSPIFKHSGLPVGPDGGLVVNEFLQSPKYPDIFGGGDCIFFQNRPLNKVGVYAVRENPVLCHNLMARIEGKPLQPFDPGGDYLLIFNLGDGTGVLSKKWLTFGGRPAFLIKDYIDRRFMKKFQAMEK
jgi:NADH dehydrogenase FAD-containing subunit